MSMRVSAENFNQIEKLAKKDGRSINNYVDVIVFPSFLKNLEKERKENDNRN